MSSDGVQRNSTGVSRAAPYSAIVTELSLPLLARYSMEPEAIYVRSFALIDQALQAAPTLAVSPEERHVIRRIIHATGDISLAELVRFHPQALTAGLEALRRQALLVADVRMVAAGINRAWLAASGCSATCALDAPGSAAVARARGVTRSAAAILALGRHLQLSGAIVVIGNAPTALLALLDLIDAGIIYPALIIGMPVGYVAAAESKAELVKRDVPFITIEGRRGGSPAAAATLNALLQLHLGADLNSAPTTEENYSS